MVVVGLSACSAESQSFSEVSSSASTSFEQDLKGEWSCEVAGDTFEFHSDEPDGVNLSAFGLYPKVAYKLGVDDGTWSVNNPSAYSGEGVKANGIWGLEGEILTFKVADYTYTSGSTTEPHPLGRNVVGHGFTITGAPEKLSDRATPGIKNTYNYATEFEPISDKSFQLKRDNSALICTK